MKNPESMKKRTLWKINMEPENDDLEDHFLSKWVIWRFHVNLPWCIKTDG